MPVFDEEAMRAVIGCTRGRLKKTSDKWLDETRGRIGADLDPIGADAAWLAGQTFKKYRAEGVVREST